MASSHIKAIDKSSVHRITSGQVVVDLQTAVKELVENSLDAGATNIEIRFKNYGVKSVEVIDNGSGIAEQDFESIALKHHTSKLETYEDLTVVQTFGFRGEALSSLCALSEKVSVTTATKETSPKGTCLQMQKTGEVESRSVVARQKGTTVSVTGLFAPLPVRRKEFERNAKREYNKALNLLHAYALGPCAFNAGVRMSVANISDKGQKTAQLQTQGLPSMRAAAKALWGAKSLDNVVDLDISFNVESEKSVVRRMQMLDQELPESMNIEVKGLVSQFSVGCGRSNLDRQFFYINGRPCNMSKVQKAFNEVYRTFNANQSPLIIADFTIPTNSCDINVSPDKRTILLHNEGNLITVLKGALESRFSPSRSTFDMSNSNMTQATLSPVITQRRQPEPVVKDEVMSDEQDRSLLTISTPSAGKEKAIFTSQRPPPNAPSEPDSDVILDTTKSIWSQSPPKPRTRTPTQETVEITPTPATPWRRPEPDNEDGQPSFSGPELDTPRTPNDMDPDNRSSLASPDSLEPTRITTEARESHNSPSPPRASTDGSIDANASKKRCRGAASESREIFTREHGSELRARKKRIVSRDLGRRLASYAMPGSQLGPTLAEAGGDDDSDNAENESEKISPNVEHDLSQAASEQDEENGGDSDVDDDPSSILSSARRTLADASSSQNPSVQRPEIIKRSDLSANISVHYDLERTIKRWDEIHRRSTEKVIFDSRSEGATRIPSDAGVLNADNHARAVDALSRVIDKADFAFMNIIGQFNLGFIICRRRKLAGRMEGSMDDLFIVDQHAADEKFNFEDLQLTTKIQSQKLLRPRAIELTAADELVASENLQVLKDNGFEVEMVAEDDAVEGGCRLRLTAQPVSKNTVFDVKDLEELIILLRDSPSGTMVRCSKARAMFASRACRKSVMVGMPLNHTQMSTVVRHMGTMEQPWNCPHGRPTMRHLADITTLGSMPLKVRPVNWASYD